MTSKRIHQFKELFRKIWFYLSRPKEFIFYIVYHSRWIYPDKMYLKIIYFCRIGKRLNLKNPTTFNEKLQWLKLFAHKPIYVTMADKYAVKQFVAERIGQEYVVPCLGAWNSAKDIDFEELPLQFVLKCNHNSGLGRCICKDKSLLNIEQARKDINRGIKQNYYFPGRDKQYRDINRKIIADMFLDDNTGEELRDY